jgi:hypothetical protein
VDRRGRPGRDGQPVRPGGLQRHDVPDRPGQQRPHVPGPRTRRDRLPSLFIAAARALAALADPSDPAKGLLPDISRLREVSATVAVDVVNTATAAGIARVQVDDPIQAVHDAMWWPTYLPIKH